MATILVCQSPIFFIGLASDAIYSDLAGVVNNTKSKDENLESKISANTNTVEKGSDSDKSITVHKKHSKRSLDDAEFDSADDDAARSPPSSPG